MADKSRPRPGGSRTPTGRPRKVAGRAPLPEEPVVEEPVVEEPALDDPVVEQRAPASVVETPEADEPVVEQRAPASVVETPEADERPAGGRRTTLVLVAVIAVLALVGVAEVVYLVRQPSPTVSSARPVVTGDLTQRSAVETAARSTEQILSTTYQDYDGQVDAATTKMTDAFAAQYRDTADGIKDQFIAKRTKLQVKAVAQGVVQASPKQVQALLFLNQYVEKQQDGQPKTSFAQYRALVTVVKTDQGWLVSNIQTQ